MQRVRVASTVILISVGLLAVKMAQTQAAPPLPPLTVPSGTEVSFLVLRAALAKAVKPGDPLYMQTTYPVTVGTVVAIPAGTFLQGTIQSVTKPTRKVSHAFVTISFDKLVFPNGYAVLMHETQTLDVQVSAYSDLLLDTGTLAEVKLAQPLQLNAKHVQASLATARPVKPGSLFSATRCVPTSGTPGSPPTPGTPDIVIPGSPGTPDTVIPGVNGAPDTVIPGIPPGSPTVIAGTPGSPGDSGTPGTVCPAPPLVVSSTPATPALDAAAAATAPH